MTLSEYSVISRAVEHYGVNSQINMLFEEMSELQKELCKHLRGQTDVKYIAEEIADVEIMLAQIKCIFKCSREVRNWQKQKVNRLSDRLDQEEGAGS